MVFIRSIAFNLFFYINITLWMLVTAPFMLMPAPLLWRVIFAWSRLNLFALKWLAGIDVDVRGLHHIPATPAIFAIKHQSAFETIALLHLFRRPAFILKKELMRIPLFGWFAGKVEMIPVDRSAGQAALREMLASARAVLADGRQIIIFPEGTRRPPGAPAAYKHGIARLYSELAVPVVPVALNSGLYWPRKGLARFPGRIVVEFLPAIEPGLDGGIFFDRMRQAIEQRSDALLIEAAEAVPRPPLSSEAEAHIANLTRS